MPSLSGIMWVLPTTAVRTPIGAEIVAERELTDRQRHPVPSSAVAEHGAARIEGRARRAADGGLHIGTIETQATGGQSVDVRCFQMRMPVAAEVIEAELVRHDEQDVFDIRHGVTSSELGSSVAMGGAMKSRIRADKRATI